MQWGRRLVLGRMKVILSFAHLSRRCCCAHPRPRPPGVDNHFPCFVTLPVLPISSNWKETHIGTRPTFQYFTTLLGMVRKMVSPSTNPRPALVEGWGFLPLACKAGASRRVEGSTEVRPRSRAEGGTSHGSTRKEAKKKKISKGNFMVLK